SNPYGLHRTAEAIRAGYAFPDATTAKAIADDDEETGFPEGRVIYRLHRARERSRAVVAKKKEHALQQTGHLACESCGFDFAATYGPTEDGYIECHHAAPLASVADRTVTKIQDLVLLCANCHRIVHRKRPWLSPDAVRALIR